MVEGGRPIRVRRAVQHVSVPWGVLSDQTLSWEARGVMAYLLGHPQGETLRAEDLITLGLAGRDQIQRILRELRRANYIKQVQERTSEGTIFYRTELYECPQQPGKPSMVQPYTGEPLAVNPVTDELARLGVTQADLDWWTGYVRSESLRLGLDADRLLQQIDLVTERKAWQIFEPDNGHRPGWKKWLEIAFRKERDKPSKPAKPSARAVDAEQVRSSSEATLARIREREQLFAAK